ncbi:MAG: hypothetical protein LBI19_10725 [Oscillospiraceae bacterium]|jgi:uridine kinase|nr:hypothetical protein [Oscillospiraceae bacterium]
MLPLLGIDTWKEKSLSDFAAEILHIRPKPLILIDGDGGSGKTTLAKRLAEILNANLVSSDDICWCADPIHWDDEMLTCVVRPWLDGKNVAHRPTGWVKENRPGFIAVDAKKALIIEGMGACRKTLRKVAAYSIWVDTEPDIARTRVIERDLAAGENGGTLESVTEVTDWWDSLVHPFLLEEEPWKYVDTIVSGSQSDLFSDNPIINFT